MSSLAPGLTQWRRRPMLCLEPSCCGGDGWASTVEARLESREANGYWRQGQLIALFTDNILHLHYNETGHECEAISGKNDKTARNCLLSTLHCTVVQMSKVICEKRYWTVLPREDDLRKHIPVP